MVFDLYTIQHPSYHVVMKWFPLALLMCASAFAVEKAQLTQVHSVYILPMGNGMDQYLANKITRSGLFDVVTDPQRADAVLTDRLGEPFERKLDEFYPPPKPAKPEKIDKADDTGRSKDDSAVSTDTASPLVAATPIIDHPSTFGRGKGTFFLVDRKSRAVLWSTYNRAHDASADTLDKKADQIVSRLKHDLKVTKEPVQ
jgi:hypothetical protein